MSIPTHKSTAYAAGVGIWDQELGKLAQYRDVMKHPDPKLRLLAQIRREQIPKPLSRVFTQRRRLKEEDGDHKGHRYIQTNGV